MPAPKKVSHNLDTVMHACSGSKHTEAVYISVVLHENLGELSSLDSGTFPDQKATR